MENLKLPAASFCFLALAVLLSTPTACRVSNPVTQPTSQGREEDPTALEQSKKDEEGAEEYWTPERMREAKPVELPAPDTPPIEETEPPSAPPAGEASGEPGQSPATSEGKEDENSKALEQSNEDEEDGQKS